MLQLWQPKAEHSEELYLTNVSGEIDPAFQSTIKKKKKDTLARTMELYFRLILSKNLP